MHTNIDTFMCVHHHDLDYLCQLALRSYLVNFEPKGRLILICNDRAQLQAFADWAGLSAAVVLSSDDEWLSARECTLPGWYRQQVIKLRAYQFCEGDHFCNLGADTVLLQPVQYDDLVAGNFPILYYRRHMPPTIHLAYEWQRVGHVGRILQLKPVRARRYVDFINDVFCFNRDALMGLEQRLRTLYGNDPYYTLLRSLGTHPRDQKKFGEWTLYSTYVLDWLKHDVTLRNSAAGFSHQVHSVRSLRRYQFDSKVVHFVSKEFDVEHIEQLIMQQQCALGKYLAA